MSYSASHRTLLFLISEHYFILKHNVETGRVKHNITSQNLLQPFHTWSPFCLYPRPVPGSAHPHQPPHLRMKSNSSAEIFTSLNKKRAGPGSPSQTNNASSHRYRECPRPLQIHCSLNCLHLCLTEVRVLAQSHLHKCNR